MKVIYAVFLSVLVSFVLLALGWWLHILFTFFDKLDEKKQLFIVFVLILGAIGMLSAMTGMLLS